jgi:signal peptidase I
LKPSSNIQIPANNLKSRSWLRVAVIGRNPRLTLLRAAVWSIVCFLIFKIALVRVVVIGVSMLPTCPEYSRHWINRTAYFWHEPERGDIVAIRLAGIHEMLLKRIIGLPGETVAFENGRVLINGKILDEPYEKNPCDWNLDAVTLTNGQYFVVGDNRNMPADDHYKGRCQRDRIIGKLLK